MTLPVFLMKYVAYRNVSTQKQGSSGLGRDAQGDAVMCHARSRGADVIAEFTEIAPVETRSVSFISTLIADNRLEAEVCDMLVANRLSMHHPWRTGHCRHGLARPEATPFPAGPDGLRHFRPGRQR